MFQTKNIKIGLTAAVLALSMASAHADAFRPPAVPLVTSDPYLSIWSEADHLNDKNTVHWTHRENSLVSLIRIDGQSYRLMGDDPVDVAAFPQVGLQVFPTRSIYDFDDSHVHVTMTFTTPLLPDRLDIFARPVTYISWSVRSVDGKSHAVSLYDSASSEMAVNTLDQPVTWKKEPFGPLTALSVGTQAQTFFRPAGDDTRIDWGYAYLAAPSSETQAAIGGDAELLQSFTNSGAIPTSVDSRQPRPVSDDQPVMAFTFNLGGVGQTAVSRHVLVAYDEIYSIDWFGTKLRPYWRRNGATPSSLLQDAEADYTKASSLCADFDSQLMADMTTEGGARYAQITALAYRQSMAACGLAADANKQPLFLTKENTSNGDLATVDVIFPMDPITILLSPTLAKATVTPILAYSASPHWKFPNAPHDLGTYPIAEGRDNGGEAMVVEESGNMLILCDAIAHDDGNADFSKKYWPQLTQWAQFLEQYGLDPGDQLCTDDFMGHLAHNANLSIKAVVGLAAYGDLCRMRGETATADRYENLAKTDAAHWVSVADAGDHSLLAFDKPGTWSQKYNLVWDKLLGLNVFPHSVSQNEIAYYKTVMQPYGVPLDSRTHLTKTDWSVWSATMADSQADFETLISPIYDYLNTTTTRDPLSDSYVTDKIESRGMHARPVVGGLFIKMLDNPILWKKWASKDTIKPGDWAPLPAAPKVTMIVPTSETAPQTWRYTLTAPQGDAWTKPNFDDSFWQKGPAPFASTGTPNVTVGTPWKTDDIWLRRTFTMPAGRYDNLELWAYHDEDLDVYINGVPAAGEAGYDNRYKPLDLSPTALALLKPGAQITLTAHCHQTIGGQGIDLGLANVTYPKQ